MKALTYESVVERMREVFRELYAPKTASKQELDELALLIEPQIKDFARLAQTIPSAFLSQEHLEKAWFKDIVTDTFDTFLQIASLKSELAKRVYSLG